MLAELLSIERASRENDTSQPVEPDIDDRANTRVIGLEAGYFEPRFVPNGNSKAIDEMGLQNVSCIALRPFVPWM